MRSPKDIPICKLLPHRPPAVLIDALQEASETRGVGVKTFRPGDYGLYGGCVCEPALIECAAQTVAALFGYNALSKPAGSGLGVLAGISSFLFLRKVSVGEILRIEVEAVRSFGVMHVIEAKIFSQSAQVAGGELKLYLHDKK